MRIGIFGGSFDPPHVGHLIVAEWMADAFDLDEVVWIPAAQSPHKQGAEQTAADVRLRMVEGATAGNPRFSVTDLELRRGGVSYTLDTLRELAAIKGDARLSLILGSDSLESFERWHEPRRILELADLLVYRRMPASGIDLPDWLAPRVSISEAPLIEISASDVRRRRALGQSIRYLVPASVEAIIEEEGLYR